MSEVRPGMQSAVGSVPGGTGGAALLTWVDAGLGVLTKAASVALLSAEIVLMLASVVARYGFGRPLVWSDELSALMFLWLAVLGAVLALRDGEHMRMSSFVNKASPATRHVLAVFSTALILSFVLLMILPALDYLDDEQMVLVSTLDISMWWRAAAMPTGFILMALSLLLQLRRWPDAATVLACGAVLALFAAVLVFTPWLHALGRGNLAVFFLLGVGGLVFAGVPIAFAFGAATLGYLATSTHVPMSVLVARVDAGMSHQILLSVPLFVFLGLLMEMTGMAASWWAASPACWDTCAAACLTCWLVRCTWFPASRAPRRRTWRPSSRCCFRRWRSAACGGASWWPCWPRPGRRPRRSRPA